MQTPFATRSLCCFEVVDRLDLLHHLDGGPDVGEELCKRLVGLRALIQGRLVDAGRVDALHQGAVLFEAERPPRLSSAHEAPCSVGGGVVPLFVPFASAEERAVPHIERDDEGLPLLGGDGALAQDHLFGIDVVVDGGEAVDHSEGEGLDDCIGDGLAVEVGVALHEAHVREVLFTGGALQGGQRVSCPLGGDLLVVGGHLQSDMAAAGVDDQVAFGILVRVDLDEVVAPSQ